MPKPETIVMPEVIVASKVNYAPLWHVILHNDDDHSYNYVVAMLMQVFGKTQQRAFEHAQEVNDIGATILDTTSQERAELKRDQIHAFGPDPLIAHCAGSMSASIERAE